MCYNITVGYIITYPRGNFNCFPEKICWCSTVAVQLIRNQQVAVSNPATSSNPHNKPFFMILILSWKAVFSFCFFVISRRCSLAGIYCNRRPPVPAVDTGGQDIVLCRRTVRSQEKGNVPGSGVLRRPGPVRIIFFQRSCIYYSI